MTDREKQIEEMAKDIRIVNELQTSDKYMPWYSEAICLMNLGYRKIPEDSIVISKQEYEDLKDYTRLRIKPRSDATSDYILSLEMDNAGLVNRLKEIRKETASRILNEIQTEIFHYLGVKNIKEADKLSMLSSLITYDLITDKLYKLAKQYGVDLEE